MPKPTSQPTPPPDVPAEQRRIETTRVAGEYVLPVVPVPPAVTQAEEE